MRGFGFGPARLARRRLGGVLPPQLGALTLAASGIVENSAAATVVGGLLGRTTGSTLTLVNAAGARFALAGATLVAGATATDYESATSHQVTVREALAGYGNSPRDTVLTVTVSNVFEQPSLAALGLSATSLTIGTAASGSVTGATAGSTVAAAGLPAGLTVDGPARTWAWSGSGTAGSASVTLTETLADSANSPRASSIGVTIATGALPNFRAALAAAKAGTAGPLFINVIGDSTVVGAGAGVSTSSVGNNARGHAISQQLGDSFAASAGLAKNGADIFGFGFTRNTGTAAEYAGFNSSVTPGSWTFNNNLYSLGGNMWNCQAAGANFGWTAENRQFNRLAIYYVTSGGLGNFRIRIDGVARPTSVTNGAGGIGKTVYADVPLGTHVIEMEWVSGSVYVIGLETLDTTAKASVRIRNLGQGSVTSGDIIDNGAAWRPRQMLAALEAASLHVIEGGVINDWLQGTAVATVSGNLTTMMAAAQTNGGDVLLLGPTRSATAGSPSLPAAVQQSYVDAMAALANGTTKAFYDLKTGVGDYAAMNAAGRMIDTLHPNADGYGAEAAALYGAIAA